MASEYKNTERFVRTYANQVESEIETRLRNNGKYASGKLYDSIRYELTDNGQGRFNIKFKMASYGEYVDKGVNGYEQSRGSKYSFKPKTGKGTGRKSAFITSLQKWCTIKGIDKGAAFAIRRNIWKYGIVSTNFFTIPTTRRVKQFAAGYKKNLSLDIEQMIKNDLKKGLKVS